MYQYYKYKFYLNKIQRGMWAKRICIKNHKKMSHKVTGADSVSTLAHPNHSTMSFQLQESYISKAHTVFAALAFWEPC